MCLNHSCVQQLRTESSIAFAKYSDLALLSPANEILPSLVMYTWCLLVMFSTCIARMCRALFSRHARNAVCSHQHYDVYSARQQSAPIHKCAQNYYKACVHEPVTTQHQLLCSVLSLLKYIRTQGICDPSYQVSVDFLLASTSQGCNCFTSMQVTNA